MQVMPTGKKELLVQLQKDWKKYWELETLKQVGFRRFQCNNCKKFFWAMQEQQTCNDSSCRVYDFIGKPPTKKKFDYFETWKEIQKFFVKNGHEPLKRYPTVCRWYPLYFNIAGIVDFYRMDGKKLTFEFPANPSILNQPCLRFNDIPQVGVSGRHFTSFGMVQQSALFDGKKGYWKDKCIDLDYRLLTEVFGIKPEEINFIEDVWLGYGAFGYSLEYHIRGLEVGNAVFTEFEGTPDKFAPMREKIIDMGAGHERFTWLSQGTPTAYDAVFGNLIGKLRTRAGVKYDEDFYQRYSKLSGVLNVDEEPNIEAARKKIAEFLKVDVAELKEKLEPMQAIYAIADHTRTLLFAMADGGLPSNVGGGYNLRVILRRALGFIDSHNLPLDLHWTSERMAEYMKPAYPELTEALGNVHKILDVEEKRYRSSMERAKKTIEAIIQKKEPLSEKKIIELYDSHGITPELLQETADKMNFKMSVPADIYAKVTEKHMQEKPEQERKTVNVAGLPPTLKLYYTKQHEYKFKARVLKIVDKKYVVLNQSAFYPRGGGQEPDHGILGGCRVYDAEKYDDIIVHTVENPKFKEGDDIIGEVDKTRREQITVHHDATHVINSAARQILGPWVWQEGSKKDIDKAHLDVDHYEALTEGQIEQIEYLVNKVVKSGGKITKIEMERTTAEKKYGFTIYQGAAVPSKKIRIVNIKDFDIEACGGTHGDHVKGMYPIIITKVERPADGIVRFIYRAGPAAENYLKEMDKIAKESAKLLGTSPSKMLRASGKLIEEWKKAHAHLKEMRAKYAEKTSKKVEFEDVKGLKVLIKKVGGADINQLQQLSKALSEDNTVIILFGITDKVSIFGSAGDAAVKHGVNIGKLVSTACQKLGGKGGGRENLAQGVGVNKDYVDAVIGELKKLVQ